VQELTAITSDPEAFERFYREHVEAVQRFDARRASDPYQVADLTADIFVAAIDSAASYRRSRGEPVAWLFGIAWAEGDVPPCQIVNARPAAARSAGRRPAVSQFSAGLA
jgi:RNA polymerase sigma-70 factor (ECF subfamily)